ncbi:MAG: hypothetical protein IPK19_20395 [Chloroflexi bacterium]|nr:hypothetical protein [Chloroflexota bacterium]
MYRTGHGDCFLLALAGQEPAKPVYVLIDCGSKPGSPKFIGTSIDKIVDSIYAATGGHLDIAVLTHEHQDHLDGISQARFDRVEIGETWLAWTENPEDKLANKLRKTYKDTLLGLLEARNRLQVTRGADDEQVERLERFLGFELGGEAEALFGAAVDPANSRRTSRR